MSVNEPASPEYGVEAGEHSGEGKATNTPADTVRVSSARPAVLNKKKLQKLQEQYERRGVVYISRIPPHMVGAVGGDALAMPSKYALPTTPLLTCDDTLGTTPLYFLAEAAKAETTARAVWSARAPVPCPRRWVHSGNGAATDVRICSSSKQQEMQAPDITTWDATSCPFPHV